MEIKIRNEEAKDIEQVRSILRAAFPTEEESKLVDALRTNGKAITLLVAVSGDDVLGHILFSPVSTTPPNEASGLSMKDWVSAKNLNTTIVLCLATQNIISALVSRRRAATVYTTNTGVYGVDDEFMLIQFLGDLMLNALIRYAPEFSFFFV